MNLLHRLAAQELPISVVGGAEVDAVRVLRMAGHIKADIPRPLRTLNGYTQPPATVHEITSLGRTMIKRFPRR